MPIHALTMDIGLAVRDALEGRSLWTDDRGELKVDHVKCSDDASDITVHCNNGQAFNVRITPREV